MKFSIGFLIGLIVTTIFPHVIHDALMQLSWSLYQLAGGR
jgi:hypothetical protein